MVQDGPALWETSERSAIGSTLRPGIGPPPTRTVRMQAGRCSALPTLTSKGELELMSITEVRR